MSEITNNTDTQDITSIYNLMAQTRPEALRDVEEQVEGTTAPVAEETAEKAEEVKTVPAKVAPAKKALPAVKLVKLFRGDFKKKDAKLVAKHVPSRVKNIKWDPARSVTVIIKSGKERAYKIGRGAAPALIESKKHADIVNYLKNM